MALSSRLKNRLMDAINTSFSTIGHSATTRMPKNTSNKAPYAWEYLISCHLASLANKRKEQAEKAAVKAGVLIDKDKNPQPPGTREVIYNDDVSITMEVRMPSIRVDVDVMIEYLIEKAGVKETIVYDAEAAATKANKPAHVFTAHLVGDSSED
jgi:hypothetical protein